MKLSAQQKEIAEIAAVAVPVAAGIHYASAADDLVSDPTNTQKQSTASTAKSILVFSLFAGGLAFFLSRR